MFWCDTGKQCHPLIFVVVFGVILPCSAQKKKEKRKKNPALALAVLGPDRIAFAAGKQRWEIYLWKNNTNYDSPSGISWDFGGVWGKFS